MKIPKLARWVVSVGTAGVLLATSACSSGEDDPDQAGDDGGESVEATEVDPASAEIRTWDGVCDVFDPDSIAAELGAEYDEDGPAEIGEDEGQFLGALSCNALYKIKSDPDQTQGFMYLNLSPSDNADLAKEQYDQLWDEDYAFHNEQDPSTQIMLGSDDDMPGDWDEAASFVSVGSAGDRVWAYYLEGSYMVQIQLSWGPDSSLHAAAIDGEEDLSEFAELDFTPLDIGTWVKDTYLPQVHEAISAKIAEGTGE